MYGDVLKFENKWSIGNLVTIGILAFTIIASYGSMTKESEVYRERVDINSVNILENSVKIDHLENKQIAIEKDIEEIRKSNERMEVKINKILDKMNIID